MEEEEEEEEEMKEMEEEKEERKSELAQKWPKLTVGLLLFPAQIVPGKK